MTTLNREAQELPPSSQEEIRNAALEEAAMICEYWHSSSNAWTAVEIRKLKSQPSAPHPAQSAEAANAFDELMLKGTGDFLGRGNG